VRWPGTKCAVKALFGSRAFWGLRSQVDLDRTIKELTQLAISHPPTDCSLCMINSQTSLELIISFPVRIVEWNPKVKIATRKKRINAKRF
jgi:hypothetical protein